MKRILIYGMKSPAGGVESAVMAYVRHFDPDVITADAAVFEKDFPFTREIEERGGRVFVLPVRRTDPKAYSEAVEKLFRDNRYDAVWCNFSGLTNIDFLKLAKKYGVKKRVAHSHTTALAWGSPVMEYVVKGLHEKNKLVIGKYATDFFGCSRRSAEFMFGRKYGGAARVIPNAVEAVNFVFSEDNRNDVRNEFSVPRDAFVLGHVGRMCYAKNQKFLIDVFDKLSETNKDARLLFVGDGEMKDEIISYAETKKCRDKIIFTLSRTDTPRLYSAMDAFCLPSLNEGFPVTLVEAQASGLPCFVSAEAVDETVDVTGLLTRLSVSSDAGEWAQAILRAKTGRDKAPSGTIGGSRYDITTAAKELQNYFTEAQI